MSFYVTLPSNASTDHFINTQSNYTTNLSKPLNFNVPYEVALSEFSYREFLIFEIGNIMIKYNTDQEFRPLLLTAYDNEPIDHLISRLNFEILQYYTALEYFTDLDPKIDNSLFIKKNKETIEFSSKKYQETYNLVKLKCPSFKLHSNSLNAITLVIPENTQVKFTGFGSNLFQTFSETKKENFDFLIMSELLNFYDYLMVYCDIVSFQIVGDTTAPLLRTITKTEQFNRTTEKIFFDPHYIPVTQSFIPNINIDIRYPTGEQAKFGNSLSKVIAKLHFRPIINE